MGIFYAVYYVYCGLLLALAGVGACVTMFSSDDKQRADAFRVTQLLLRYAVGGGCGFVLGDLLPQVAQIV